jgi:type IV pilus assembly protein PilC
LPRFRFRAVDSTGQGRQGEAAAESHQALVSHLQGQGLTVIDVEQVVEEVPAAPPSAEIHLELGVSRKALSFFTRQLATTLTAGLPLLRALSTLHRQTSSRSLRRVLEDLGQKVQQGSSLSEAMARHPQVFDALYLNMVRVGETGGDLPQAIERLADLLEKQEALARKVRTAMAYPAFVLVFSVVMAYCLVAFLMPGFNPIFASSGLDIPRDYPLTHLLMQASRLVSSPLFLVAALVVVVGAILLARWVQGTPGGRRLIDGAKFHFPFLQTLFRQTAVARFCRSFATLTQAGVPLLQALSLVADSSGNEVMAQAIRRLARQVQEGEKLSETLARSGMFPDLAVQMVAVGEEAGKLPEMLERMARYYESEMDAQVSSLTALVEPCMMVLVGLMVGVFVMGILLPILGMSSAYQGQVR